MLGPCWKLAEANEDSVFVLCSYLMVRPDTGMLWGRPLFAFAGQRKGRRVNQLQ